MKTFFMWVSLVVAFIGFLWVIGYGWDKQDEIDCNKWAKEANLYAGYWLTEGQKAQCDHFGIDVNAPVKKYNEYK